MKNHTTNKRKKDIIKSIRLINESLDSHLDSTGNERLKGGIVGNRHFHKKTIKEYHYKIGVLIEML